MNRNSVSGQSLTLFRFCIGVFSRSEPADFTHYERRLTSMEQTETKTRKTDRRTIYTKNVIKDALLEALTKRTFDHITVTEVCRTADITRATFYLHFDSLTDVLDELLKDALLLAEETTVNPEADVVQLVQMISEKKPEEMEGIQELLPVCHRACQLPKYKVIFRDESISGYVVNQLVHSQKKKLVPAFAEQFHISPKDAEMLVLFVINGTYSVNRALKWQKGEQWYRVHSLLMKLLSNGYQGLCNSEV